MVKKLLLLLLIISSGFYISAESKPEFDLELYNSIYRMDKDFYTAGHGNAGMTFKSRRSSNVKGYIEIDFDPNEASGEKNYTKPLLELKKAYIKVRMPDHRLTVGKTRTSWGEGTVFNSGDVIFGSLNPYVDLTKEEKREETSWMTGTNTPFGAFSFVELVFLPPQTEITEDGITSSLPGGRLEKSTIGGRLYTKIAGTKFETGYVYKGEKRTDSDPHTKTHRPYISLQGNIGPDWSLSASSAIPAELNPDVEIIKKTFSVSFSLFQIVNIDYDSSLHLRLEGLLLPWQNWKEKRDLFEIPDNTEAYGIFIYPQIVYNISPGLNMSLQSIVSPVDLSAMTTLGSFWNLFQDFEILNYLTFNTGERTDIFPWESRRIRGIVFTSGLRYRF